MKKKTGSEFSYDVCFYEAFEEEATALKQFLPNEINAVFTWKTIQESGHKNPVAPIISTRTQSRFPLDWSGQLSAILSRSTGFDHLIRYRNATNTSADLGYLPLYCNRAVAEQAMLLWMALLRKFPRQTKQFQSFNRDGLTGKECKSKSLLVFGVGNIGYEVVKIGLGLGMAVKGVDLVERHEDVLYIDKKVGIQEADIIVCAMNLTEDNINYFNYEYLKSAAKGAIFINIARGEMSPVLDMLKLIKEGHLGGLALDVFENEVKIAHNFRNRQLENDTQAKAIVELALYENVILTPHNAFNTIESVKRKAEQSIQQIENFLEKGTFLWSAGD